MLGERASPFLGERRVAGAGSSVVFSQVLRCCPEDSSGCSLMTTVRALTRAGNRKVLVLPTGSKITAQRQTQGLLWTRSKE